MGEAHPHSSKLAGVCLTAMLSVASFCSPTLADNGVTLPAEWYFGRWARGTQINIDKIWRNGISSIEWGSASYTGNNFRVLSDDVFRDYLIVSHDSKATVTSRIYGYYRPASNLQVGISPVSYVATDQKFYPSAANPRYYRTQRENLQVGWILDWRSKSDVLLPEAFARYQYLSDTVVAPGQWLIRANGGLEPRSNQSFVVAETNDSTLRMDSKDSDAQSYAARAKAYYGISNRLVLSLSAEYMSRSTSTNSSEIESPEWTQSASYIDQGRHSLTMELDPVFRPIGDVYLSGNVAVGFDHETLKTAYSSYVDGSIVDSSGPDRKTALDSYSVGVRFDYISRGHFDSRIVLDDFNGYYHRQLFKNQFHGSIQIGYRESELSRTFGTSASPKRTDESGDMTVSLSYGITSKLAASASAWYRWGRGRASASSESLQPHFDVMYRSYKYSPENAATWKSESELDVATGPIVPAGHIYAFARVALSTLYSSGNPGFLAFHISGRPRIIYVGPSVTTGIGRGMEITTALSWNYGYDYGNTEIWNVTIRTHLFSRVQFQLNTQYATQDGHYTGLDPVFFGHLTVLL